jgi:hypothetical protein
MEMKTMMTTRVRSWTENLIRFEKTLTDPQLGILAC